jgi:hypothetical protein
MSTTQRKRAAGPWAIHRISGTFYQVETAGGRNLSVNPQGNGSCTCWPATYRGETNCAHLMAVRSLIAAGTLAEGTPADRKE